MKNFFKSINPFTNEEVENRWLYLIKILLKYATVYIANMIVTAVVLVVVHLLCGYDIFYQDFMDKETLEIIIYYCHIFSVLLTIVLVAKVDKSNPSYLGLKKKKIHQTFYGVLYAIIAVLVVILVLVACGQYKFIGLNPNRDYKKVFLFLGAFIIYALAEELLCRGLIENHLKDKFSIHLCVFVSFIAFCIPHLIELFSYELKYSLVAVLNLLIISYIFSLLLDVYDNVFVCIGFHTTWNVLFYTVIGSNINGSVSESSIFSFTAKHSLLNGGIYGIEYGIITAIVVFVFSIILTLVLKKVHKNLDSKLLLMQKNNKKTDL